MIKETYDRLAMDITQFDVEDIITTSGVGPGPGPGPGPNPPDYDPGDYEHVYPGGF